MVSINAYGYAAEEVKKFTLEPLPYAYDALEPYIDKETMTLHHDKHHQAYVDNLNKALEKYPALYNKSLVELLSSPNKIPADVRTAVLNNAGGDYNHNFFWSIMGPNKGGVPTGDLAKAIDRDFGSFDKFKESFSNAALGRFGSGWAWLLSDKNGKLSIVSTANQDTPIPLNLTPIIAIDVWEHAYYLKYQNRRNEYINNWWNVVNWDNALDNYTKRK
ncbi:MAG: superoxide dismutase [Clostridium sp.]|uniref:superoxide dismutase n=1 Tax=Clostridium sp. TaxID=1506 RepID=UPI0030310E90